MKKLELTDALEALELDARIYNTLTRGTKGSFGKRPIITIGDLVGYSANELLSLRNFGSGKLYAVRAVLHEHGFRLKDDKPFKLAPKWSFEDTEQADIKKSIADLITALTEGIGSLFDNFDWAKDFFTAREMLEEIVKCYISEVEGFSCSADKASFVAGRILQAIEKKQHLSLSETYADYAARNPDHQGAQHLAQTGANDVCYWCPRTIADTKQAMSLIFELMHSFSQQRNLAEKLQDAETKLQESEQVLSIFDNREFRSKFLAEWRAEHQKEIDARGDTTIAGHPDADYIYKLYYEQKARIIELENKLKNYN